MKSATTAYILADKWAGIINDTTGTYRKPFKANDEHVNVHHLEKQTKYNKTKTGATLAAELPN